MRGGAISISHKRKSLRLILLFVAATIVFSGTLFWFQRQLEQDLDNLTNQTLSEVINQQTSTFRAEIDGEFELLQTLSRLAAFVPEKDFYAMCNLLNTGARDMLFSSFAIADSDGISTYSNGEVQDVSDTQYFAEAMAGRPAFSEPYRCERAGDYVVTLAVPIYRDGMVANVLHGSHTRENLSKLFTVDSFNGKGYAYIVNQSGDLIVQRGNDFSLIGGNNSFDILSNSVFSDGGSFENVKATMASGGSGSVKYNYNGNVRIARFEPLGINGWYVLSVVPSEAITALEGEFAGNTYVLIIIIIAVFVALLWHMVSLQRKHIKALSQIAYVDPLTGAANRKKFIHVAKELLCEDTQPYAFVILDVNQFKILNDTLGYNNGDALLKLVAEVLKAELSEGEIFGRCESDEYYILLKYVDNELLKKRLNAIIMQIEFVFSARVNDDYNLVMCAGVYIADRAEDINSISDRARHARKLAKGSQESRIAFYSEEIRDRFLTEKVIENKMRAALDNSDFLLYLQPKIRLCDEKLFGAEALVRWNDGDSGVIYPDAFIPVFEKNGFITRLDMYMLRKTCQALRGWIDDNITPVPVSINFSRLHLNNKNFVDDIALIVEEYDIPPHLIEIELTESTMFDNEEVLIEVLEQLHEHGFTLSMDDFGSGYSSLGLLKNLPVDVIKLDRTFFTEYSNFERAKTVISSMLSMARKLGIQTVAEGVETKENIDLLRELGCDIVQGYYYAKPMAEELLKEQMISGAI